MDYLFLIILAVVIGAVGLFLIMRNNPKIKDQADATVQKAENVINKK